MITIRLCHITIIDHREEVKIIWHNDEQLALLLSLSSDLQWPSVTCRCGLWCLVLESTLIFVITRIVCGTGSMKQSSVRLSFCLSVPSVDSSSGVGRFAAERPVGRRYRSAAAGVGFAYQLQARSAATAPQHGAQQQRRHNGAQQQRHHNGAQQQMRAVSCWQPTYSVREKAKHGLVI